MKWSGRWLVGAFAVALGACDAPSEDPSESGVAEVRDSAGIEVATYRGPGAWGEGERWSATEDLVIRGDEARPETLFGRVEDVGVDGGGRIYVLDGMASTIRVFSPEGATVRSIGGPGEGPGELSGFANGVLVTRGDTLLVPDWPQSRVSRFLPDGTVLESLRIPGPGGRSWWTLSPDGSLVGRHLERFLDDEGRWSGRDRLVELARDGSGLDTLMIFEYAQSDLGSPGDARVPLLVNSPAWTLLPGGRVAWTTLDAVRVRIHEPGVGTVRTLGHEEWSLRLATEAEKEDLVEMLGVRFGMLGADPGLVEGLTYLEEETVPAVTGVRAGPDGTLWVQRMGGIDEVHPFAMNSPDHPEWIGGSTWDVFEPQGRYLGPVELPPRLRVMRLTEEAVYGVRRDELDAEEVVRLRLER